MTTMTEPAADTREAAGHETDCYAGGTLILTPEGERRIEDLRPGDIVLTLSQEPLPVIWVGARRINFAHHPHPRAVMPIRVVAGAFGPVRPHRDLILSPDHAIFAGGVLIPVRLLLNGTTIVQQSMVAVNYHHIELPRHEVIVAEGLPTESYLDTGNRASFQAVSGAGQGQNARLSWKAQMCAPVALQGEALDRVSRALLRRAELMRPLLTPSYATPPSVGGSAPSPR